MARDLVAAKVHLEKAAAQIRRQPDLLAEQTGVTLHGLADQVDVVVAALRGFIV